MGTERIAQITFLQAFAITLVVLGHSFPEIADQSLPSWAFWSYRFIYAFHMPLFFFISGLLFERSSCNPNFFSVKYIHNRAVRLLVPYLCLTTVAFFIKAALSGLAHRKLAFSISGFVEALLYSDANPVSFFWFIPVIFICSLIGLVTRHVIGDGRTWRFLAILGLAAASALAIGRFRTVAGVDAVGRMFLYFWAGVVAYQWRFELRRYLVWFWGIPVSGIFIASLLVYNLTPASELVRRCLMISAALSGIFVSCWLSDSIAHKPHWTTTFVSRNSYQIFLLSWFFSVPVRIAYEQGFIGFLGAFFTRLIVGIGGPLLVTAMILAWIPLMRPIIGLSTKPTQLNRSVL